MQCFTTAKILPRHVSHCFDINGKQMIKMIKTGKTVKFENNIRKLKLPLMICIDSESTFEPQNNGKQNPGESYMNKYQNHVGCTFCYK